MSEPIALTERERAVFESLAAALEPSHAPPGDARFKVARSLRAWLASQPIESTSPPRVPGASAQLAREGVESGPGQPIDPLADEDIDSWLVCMARASSLPYDVCSRLDEAATEIRRLREQVQTERRAGIEAAAQRLDDRAREHLSGGGYRKEIEECAAAIRALADKPAPSGKGG